MAADHILTFARTLDGGGVERAQLRLARAWIEAGRRVTLLIGDRSGPLATELPPGLDLVDLGTPSFCALATALPRLIRDRRPDLLFCAGSYYTSAAAWARLVLGLASPPIVAKMSNAPDRGDHGILLDIAHRRWLTLHGRFLDALVAMTPATAATAARLLRMDGRVSVIPNPPPPPVPGAVPVALPGTRVILGVGRLVPQKRWDRLIDVIPLLPADVTVVILGEGPLRADLAAKAAAGADRVHLPGHVANPVAMMEVARVIALTSDYEGVPGVLREALSVGTPVVSTDSSEAIAEIVIDASLGTIVPRDDPQALARALTHWLDAPRPPPVPLPGLDSGARYLALFDSLV
ncbi:glycosyltransferase [Sphingomonas oligophenolica]|uniref:Glycosyltransferase n=1 Tax=Sphingomonas oligophenolica TaxID=301154 RepID=A0A502CRM6_9SPHN|nr:glycosyltransferase [Sphingomonas oligophenolica]TPG15483.1 glycosyltransferase [Sphingomonas oligophenolica]